MFQEFYVIPIKKTTTKTTLNICQRKGTVRGKIGPVTEINKIYYGIP